MKKQIHIIVKYFYPVAAGIETNILETYSVLAEKGWDVVIHTSKDTAIKKNCLKKYETYRNLKIKRYPFSWYGFFPDFNWAQTDIVALHNFDIFPHLHILIYSLLLKILGKKRFSLILTPHGGFNPEWRVFGKMKGFVKRFYHFTLGTILINSTVDAIRGVSEWEKQEMLRHNIRDGLIHVITNGIENEAYMDVDKFAGDTIKDQVKGYGRYILQIGRIYMIKNYETTIKALAKLPKDVKFVIAGAPDKNPSYKKINYMNELKKLTASLGLEDRVIFAGVVRGIDKYYLIKHAQMMVHMALWESYCNVVHEGMSQGLICVVANNTALPLLIKNGINGYVIDTFDSHTLASKIAYVLKNSNSKKLSEIKQHNKQIALENSWRKVAGKLDVLYNSLLVVPKTAIAGRRSLKIFISRNSL